MITEEQRRCAKSLNLQILKSVNWDRLEDNNCNGIGLFTPTKSQEFYWLRSLKVSPSDPDCAHSFLRARRRVQWMELSVLYY